MYAENTPAAPPDPYSQEYTDAPPPPPPAASDRDAPPPPPPPRGRSRSRSPRGENGYRSPYRSESRRSPPPPASAAASAPKKPAHAPVAPNPSPVLGVFGLSIRTQERDLDDEFSRFGQVEKVTIVYDQRSDRSRGFGFIRMNSIEDATRCIQELNGIELNGRRIRVDYSVTDRPHNPTPGEYMGHRRQREYGRDRDRDRDSRDSYKDRDRDYPRRDRDRDYYGRDSRDSRDWRDRRSPPPRARYSPEYRRRRSYSRSPPRGSSPTRRDYDAPSGEPSRW